MKHILYIIGIMFTLLFATTCIVSAETNTTITKIDTDSGNYYAEFDHPLDWIVIKQSTGALIWINDSTEYSFDQVKELAMSANPSLVHGVNYWGIITGIGAFTKAEGDFQLPLGFLGNQWGTYWFMEDIGTHKFYVDIEKVSNVTYSYTETITPPVEPPKPPDNPNPTDKPDVPTTPTKDHSPQTGDMDYQTAWILGLMAVAVIGLWYNTYYR